MSMNGTQNPVTTPPAESSGGKRLREPERRARQSGEKRRRRVSAATRWRRLSWAERLILLAPVAAAVVVVVAVNLFFTRKLMSCELEGKPCQYYGGSVYRMEEGTTLLRTSEGKTMIKDSGGQHAANDLPIYYEDRDEATITQDMVYYAPRSGAHGRLGYFTQLRKTASGRISLTRDGKELGLESGFLYSGQDLYIFLEPVILTFNGYRIALPPLSYVEAVYTGDVMVFNYASKEFFMESPQGPVMASIETGDYEISLLNDSMTNYAGKRTLLFSRPELLDPVG